MAGVEVDPVELHVAGDTVSTATDDATLHLTTTTGSDCAGGFPGTSAAAHAALVQAWEREDRDLATGLHAVADLLHRSAEIYRATDDANAARLTRPAGAGGTSFGDGVSGGLDM